MNNVTDKDIVISYIGGCFGNSLSAILKTAITGIIPGLSNVKYNTLHFQSWPYDVNQSMVTTDSEFQLNRPLLPGEAVQVHCLNGYILSSKFPKAKKILLTCNKTEEIYAIHRQWKLLNDLTQPKIDLILGAWDWIEYNLNYYNANHRVLNHNDPLLLNIHFLKFKDELDKIEKFLNISIRVDQIKPIVDHINKQMETFYNIHESFQFAWDTFNEFGPDAPIVTMANKTFKSND